MSLTRKYIELNIKEWNDLFLFDQLFLSKFVFRGQGNALWPLETSLRRMVKDYHSEVIEPRTPIKYEKAMINEFKWKYSNYQDNPNMMPKENESIEWLSVMQHYGAKTRLMDFTNSLFVALYMALYGTSNADSSVWAFNKCMIKEPFAKAFETDGKHFSEEELYKEMYKSAQEWLNKEEIRDNDLDFKKLYMITPRICNDRISRQQGLFILPSTISHPFKDILKEYCDIDNIYTNDIKNFAMMTKDPDFYKECGIIKILIPNKLRYKFTKSLRQMNISAETMYPGLDGLAKSVNCLRTL